LLSVFSYFLLFCLLYLGLGEVGEVVVFVVRGVVVVVVEEVVVFVVSGVVVVVFAVGEEAVVDFVGEVFLGDIFPRELLLFLLLLVLVIGVVLEVVVEVVIVVVAVDDIAEEEVDVVVVGGFPFLCNKESNMTFFSCNLVLALVCSGEVVVEVENIDVVVVEVDVEGESNKSKS
jgi:hypothetical protein